MISVAIQGGAMRSIYCLGVIRALSESPLLNEIKEVYTSSAGCVSAAVLADQLAPTRKRTVAEIGEKLVTMLAGERFIDARRIFKMVDVDYLVDVIAKVTSVTPRSLTECSLLFEVALTNARTGAATYIDVTKYATESEMYNSFRASMAIPVLYPYPVRINSAKYVDGGITDPLPLLRAMRNSPDIVVAITSVPRGTLADEVTGKEQLVLKYIPGIAPRVRQLMLARNPLADAVDNLLDQKTFCGTRIVRVSPSDPKLIISRTETDKEKLFALENLGYSDGVRALADLNELDISEVTG